MDNHSEGKHGIKKQCISDWISVDSRELKVYYLRDDDHLDHLSPTGTTMKGDDKLLESFNVMIPTSALDTGNFSQMTKEVYPLLHSSINGPENKTHKGWHLNRVTTGDLEMSQLEIMAVQDTHAGSLPRRSNLICFYFVLLVIMALVMYSGHNA